MSHVARTDRKPPVNFGYFCNQRSTGDFRSVYVTWCSIELGLLPSTLSSTSLLLLKPVNSNLIMSTTAAKNISTNSFGFASSKASNSQKTCHICKRLLYSFEEVLVCRICDDSYHWRCVKPETITHYGENTNFLCDKCNDNIPTTNTSLSHRVPNSGIKIKSPNSSETDYRNFASIPSKLNSIPTKDTTVVNAIRYFEEKQQQQQAPSTHKISKLNEIDGHLSSQTNGQYTDDTKTIRQMQQQTGLESDDENTTTGIFQAKYQYTPLTEYAATKNDTNTNDYQKSPSPDSDQQLLSRHNGGIRYINKSRLIESSLNNSTNFTSPTIDNLSLHNRQQHFISSTNLNINDHHQQKTAYQNSLNHSTPYLSQVQDNNDSPTFKSPSHHHHQQQQIDRHSTIGSDSGIVMINTNHQHPITEDNKIIEKKLTNLVQQLGRQLETDAQKLSDKLDIKLKNLEYMIHQQTYIIRRQDEVIERLKSKILKIENERDHFRDRLSIHEQREYDEKKYLLTTKTDESTNRKTFEQDDYQQTSHDASTTRKFSNTSSVTTEHNRPSSKKTPAPRADQHGPLVNNENESTISKLIKTNPINQEHRVSDSSSASAVNKLFSSIPLLEKPAASTRLDDIIHQSNTNNVTNPSPYYNVVDEPIKISDMKSKRSSSSSSSRSSESSAAHVDKYNQTSKNNSELPPRNPNLHRSLESIPRTTSQTEGILKPSNKTASLEFGKGSVGAYDDLGTIYITPQEANHPALQYQNTVKGWLRKQNRDSFFKRIERYYCVIWNNTLLMHKHDHDRIPQKAINLQGAKVLYHEDQKYGPSLELIWSYRRNQPKHYHLYAPSKPEAQQWITGIQAAIQNLENKNKWQQYRMQS